MIGTKLFVCGIGNAQQFEVVFFGPGILCKIAAMGVFVAVGIAELSAIFEMLLTIEFDEYLFSDQVKIEIEVGVSLRIYAVRIRPLGVIGNVEFIENGSDENFTC